MLEQIDYDLKGKLNIDYIYPSLQSKTVKPLTVEQTVLPDKEYYGLSSVKVLPYEEGYQLRIDKSTLIFEKNASVKESELIL